MYRIDWVLCPTCNSKTRIKIRDDTILENFPLYCPKCKTEALINIKQFHTTVIKEPDAEPMTRRLEMRLSAHLFERDAGAAVERRVLAIPADRSYITVEPGQTAESYTAGLRQKYITALVLAGARFR